MDLYNDMAPGLQLNTSLNDIENGIFLSRNLHKLLASMEIAFLKVCASASGYILFNGSLDSQTPNFAMEVGDIPVIQHPAIQLDPLPSTCITMQYIGGFPTEELYPIPELDAKFAGNGTSPPSALLLDYIYGVTIFRRWGALGEYYEILRESAETNLIPALTIIPHPATLSLTSSHSEVDDPDDADFDPDLWEPDALQAMDDVLLLSLLLRGTASEPQHEAIQRVHDEEQALSIQEVEEWRATTVCRASFSFLSKQILTRLY
jgi:hypothetical protein